MTDTQELRDIAVHKPWVLCELTADARMQELNVLEGSGLKTMWDYLKSKHGGGRTALDVLKRQLPYQRTPADTDPRLLLKYLAQQQTWVFSEVLYRTKATEAVDMWQQPKEMFTYLRNYHGSGRKVLDYCRWIVRLRPVRMPAIVQDLGLDGAVYGL
jgi:hypothetical protein